MVTVVGREANRHGPRFSPTSSLLYKENCPFFFLFLYSQLAHKALSAAPAHFCFFASFLAFGSSMVLGSESRSVFLANVFSNVIALSLEISMNSNLTTFPANAIFYLSCYATFMEAYIGIRPTRETFARFFSLRINSVQGKEIPKPKPPVECGSCIVGSRQGSPFFKFTGLESCRAWQGTFFYVKNNGRANLIDLPPFKVGPPSRANWSYNPKTDHIETNRVVRFMASLKKGTNICSDDIIRTFISRRVLPLKRRAKDRFPLIEAERRGICVKRALDSVDPDPYIFWKDLKMGKTPAARLGRSPPKPTGSSDDLSMLEVHERVPPLRAEAGSEFVDKLMAQGQKNKQPASDAGSSQAPPSKRFRTEPLGGKEVGVRRTGARDASASGPSVPATPPPSLLGHNKFGGVRPYIARITAREGSFLPSVEIHTAGQQHRRPGDKKSVGGVSSSLLPSLKEEQLSVPKLPRRSTQLRVTRLALPFSINHSNATAYAPRTKPSGAAPTAPPPKISKLIKGKATASSAPSGPAASALHAASPRREGEELDSAWYDATNNLMLTADARKALFEELLWEHRELAEAHDKCQVIPEASIDALKEQLAAAQPAKMNEALEDAGNANSVLLAELEELAKAQKAAEEKAARLEEEQKECNRLVLQTDTLAYPLRLVARRRCLIHSPIDRLKGAKRIRGKWRGSLPAPGASRIPYRGSTPMRTLIPSLLTSQDYLDEEEDEAEEESG
ncbi:hypothetical protein QYE76_024361 [Lolium multiflorum]|uniref:Uncharacterized protein n=1 Tax=Lolium multiflorum TaxID=4521 RepID=A0AAD8VTK9_LOLMU|nr:hypothetical protein QYE76_024361 [Lolium multiflorum]